MYNSGNSTEQIIGNVIRYNYKDDDDDNNYDKYINYYDVSELIKKGNIIYKSKNEITIMHYDKEGVIIKDKIKEDNYNYNNTYNVYNIEENDISKHTETKIVETINDYIDDVYKKLFIKNTKEKENYYKKIMKDDIENPIEIKKIEKIYNEYEKNKSITLEPIKYYLLAIIKGSNEATIIVGDIFLNICMYKEAIKYYALGIKNGNYTGLINIGYAYEKRGKFEIAKKYYKMAIEKQIYKGYESLGNMYKNVYLYINKCIDEIELYHKNKYSKFYNNIEYIKAIGFKQVTGFYISINDNNDDNDDKYYNYYEHEKIENIYVKSYEYYKIGCEKGIEKCMKVMIEYYKENQNEYEINKEESLLIIEYSKFLLKTEKNEDINKLMLNKIKIQNEITIEKIDIYKQIYKKYNKYEEYYRYEFDVKNYYLINRKKDIVINYARIGDNKNAMKYGRMYYDDKYNNDIFKSIGDEYYIYEKYNDALEYYLEHYDKITKSETRYYTYSSMEYKNIINIFINYLSEKEIIEHENKIKKNKWKRLISFIADELIDKECYERAIKYIIMKMIILYEKPDQISNMQILKILSYKYQKEEYENLIHYYMMYVNDDEIIKYKVDIKRETFMIYNVIKKMHDDEKIDNAIQLSMSIIESNNNNEAVIYLVNCIIENINTLGIELYDKLVLSENKIIINIIEKLNNKFIIQYNLQKEIKIENDKECSVCFCIDKNFALYKCLTIKHKFCIKCISKMKVCPICKAEKYK